MCVARCTRVCGNMARNLPVLLFVILAFQVPAIELDSGQDLDQEESHLLPFDAEIEDRAYVEISSHEGWPSGRADMTQITSLHVKCEKDHMKVHVGFDRPFYGMIFSKGHYSDANCVHLTSGAGHTEVDFTIFLGHCGMVSSHYGSHHDHQGDLYTENTIIIQNDPEVQEIWDQARRLRCLWNDYYEKTVTFEPFNVNMLDAVTANFLGDDIQCWMQIQVGKGPWASEADGIVKIGQTMTLVLAIKDQEGKFDMMVRNCIAHDGKHQPIHLVDNNGCPVRSKIISRFQKIKNFGSTASVVSYAYFQAFKFPDSMSVHFQCVIQVCRHGCPNTYCNEDHRGINHLPSPRVPYPGGKTSAHKGALPSDHQKGGYPIVFYNRKGDQIHSSESGVAVSSEYAIASTGGKPRANNSPSLGRHRRQAGIDMKDIQTHRVIQVVAPGDVAFALPTGDNNTFSEVLITQDLASASDICMSAPGFTAGLIILLLLLIIVTMVAIFLFLRVRHLSSKSTEEQVICYENPPVTERRIFETLTDGYEDQRKVRMVHTLATG